MIKFFDQTARDLIAKAFPTFLDCFILPSSKEIATSEVRSSTMRLSREGRFAGSKVLRAIAITCFFGTVGKERTC